MSEEGADGSSSLTVGEKVQHDTFGLGTVAKVSGQKADVDFAEHGRKRLHRTFLKPALTAAQRAASAWEPAVAGQANVVSLPSQQSSKQRKAAAKARPEKPAYLLGITAAALMEKQFAPINYVIPGLVAEGAYILAGPPKLGKSWLCYDFGLAIAAGRPIFDKIPITQGDVLYLALEDSERRLKSRLLKKGIRDAPERLTLVTEWPGLDDGCITEMEAWAEAVERPSLVIVDVLKMVRGATRANESVYDADYRAMTGLAHFARTRGIAVIVVHHTRKMGADDPLESISGTNGLTGAADGIMVLKRDTGTGHFTLYVRGRDVEESEKAVRFEPDIATWKLLGEASEVGRTDERQAILDVLRKHDKPLTVREISDVLGRNYDATRKTLARMWDAGEVQKEGRGSYACPHCPVSEPDNRTDRTGYQWGNELDEDDDENEVPW